MTNKIYKIPETFMGHNCKEEYERVMRGERDKPKEKTPIAQPISFNANIVKSDYVQIPNQNFVIAIAETNFNLNYEDAHKKTIKQGFKIPDPYEFMTFYNYILDSYKNKKPVFDAAGNFISEQTKNDLYAQLTSNCWTWLNGKFNISPIKKTIEFIGGLDANDNLATKQEDLEDCLMEDCYVDFIKLTKQGLPLINSKHSNQSFSKSENIYFYSPKDGKVAGFIALSGGALLSCIWDPSSCSDLGVRAAKQRE